MPTRETLAFVFGTGPRRKAPLAAAVLPVNGFQLSVSGPTRTPTATPRRFAVADRDPVRLVIVMAGKC